MKDKMQKVYLIGVGMGHINTLTNEALAQIAKCDCVIGAKRMVESVGRFNKPAYISYRTEEIKQYLTEHPEYRRAAVLFSGDVGFYSGAKALGDALRETYEVILIPGLSAVVYLAAKIGVAWEDARLVSIHGRKQPYIHILARHRKTFLLFGGRKDAEVFCSQIRDYGLGHVKIWIGSELSYDAERLVCKRGDELQPADLKGLTVLYVENPSPLTKAFGSIADEAFIRGKVPMTKEEVRTISLAKLGLKDGDVLYDIGAGTGSVAVSAAAQVEGLTVYAIEKNPEGIELIKENQKKFCTDQITVVEGHAPAVLEGLPAPTHVFIGGSSGCLKEILHWVKQANPQVKVVINAITLETLSEALAAEREGLLRDMEVVQLSVARARNLATYHMMDGHNPIYILAERE